MSLQFILGRLHTNKKTVVYQNMLEWVKEDETSQVFYLVPDHIKFESEMNILNFIKESDLTSDNQYAGMINLQVYSFSRLAWYYLQDTAVFSRSQLTETGLSMLVRRILREKEEELGIFRGQSRLQGFVEKTTALFMEMRNGRVLPEDLKDVLGRSNETGQSRQDLADKLTDLTMLYDEFLYQLEGKYLEKEDVIEALIEEVKTRDLSQTRFVIDNFHSFSAQEQALLVELVAHAKDVHVSLVLDKKYATEPPELTDLFYETGMTYYRLYQQVRERNLPILHDRVLNELSTEHCDEINELEQYWFNSFEMSPQRVIDDSFDMTKCIEIIEAESRHAEVLHTATAIKRLVAQNNYRYKDILVVSRMMEEYKTLIESTFDENDIEVFVDQEDKMSGHALVEFIQSLLGIYKRHWRYQDIMRLLRTELFIPSLDYEASPKEQSERVRFYDSHIKDWRDKIDLLENVMLAYGYEGSDWLRDDEWIYARFHLEELDDQLDEDKRMQEIANEAKESIRKQLIPFFKRLDSAKTNRDAARYLFQFIERNGIHKQVLYWRDQALLDGDLEDARKHEQVWNTFIQLLDEFVDVLGDEEWDSDSFLSVLETGFDQATYSIVPPSIDQVMFTNFDKTRINTKKVVFILGMTDQHLPLNVENDSILTDEDRNQLSLFLPEDKFLAPTTTSRLASEPFTAYLAFMNASQKLVFSYPLKKDGEGDGRISPYISQLARHLSIPIKHKQTEASTLQTTSLHDQFSFIGSRKHTLGQLVTVLREGIDHEKQPDLFWIKLFQSLHSQIDEVERRILKSLDYMNIPKKLPAELSEKLYGKDLYLSVSQLESFYLDPYSHFLRYGLRLRERAVQELTPAETGNFFHEALDSIFRTIVNQNLSIKTMSEAELHSITDQVLSGMHEQNKYKLLSSSNRMQFIRQQLSKTIRKMMWGMMHQSKQTTMTPQKSEVLFGRLASKKGIPGLEFPLKNGGNLYVRGKIDRLDTIEVDNSLYISVVDYKSSHKTLSVKDMYHGLMLQLLTYLDTAVHFSTELFGKQAKPAGAFFAQVKNPILQANKLIGKDLLEETIKAFRMNGLVVNEDELVEELLQAVEPRHDSLVYPIKKLVKGNPSGSLILMEDLELLLKHHRNKIQEAGNLIIAGENQLAPYFEKRQFTPSVGGEYQSIAQFDVLLPKGQNKYRRMETVKNQKELIEKLKERYEEDETGEEEST